MQITEKKVSEEQVGFRKGKCCVDEIIPIRMLVKLYTAFTDLEKAYDRVDRAAPWNVLKIYGMGGQLVEGKKAFYREQSACVAA